MSEVHKIVKEDQEYSLIHQYVATAILQGIQLADVVEVPARMQMVDDLAIKTGLGIVNVINDKLKQQHETLREEPDATSE